MRTHRVRGLDITARDTLANGVYSVSTEASDGSFPHQLRLDVTHQGDLVIEVVTTYPEITGRPAPEVLAIAEIEFWGYPLPATDG